MSLFFILHIVQSLWIRPCGIPTFYFMSLFYLLRIHRVSPLPTSESAGLGGRSGGPTGGQHTQCAYHEGHARRRRPKSESNTAEKLLCQHQCKRIENYQNDVFTAGLWLSEPLGREVCAPSFGGSFWKQPARPSDGRCFAIPQVYEGIEKHLQILRDQLASYCISQDCLSVSRESIFAFVYLIFQIYSVIFKKTIL